MKVMLQRDWFSPGDLPILYLRRDNPVEVDDTLLGHLPTGAQIMGDDGKWLTKRETRKQVLKERLDKNLDASRAQLPKNAADRYTDEELLAEIQGKAPVAKVDSTVVDGPGGPPKGGNPEGTTGKTIPVQAKPGEPHTPGGEKIVSPVNPIPSGGEQSKVVPVEDLDDDDDDTGLKVQPGKVKK